MSNSNNNNANGGASNSVNPSILSLAGFMGANMRGSMTGMPGLNHMRANMSSGGGGGGGGGMNQASTSMSMNSAVVNNSVPNVASGGGWMPTTPGGGGATVNTNTPTANNDNNSSLVGGPGGGGGGTPTPGNIMWGDMADSLMERGRSKNWTYEETMELINTYTSDEWQSKFSSEKKNHRAIWAEMAEVLKKREGVTGDEARQRLNNLKALYNRIRRQLIAGEISSPQWEYWDSLHHFLTRPSQYHHAFGFPRTSPPIRTGQTPPMHSPHTPSGAPYSPMHHMQLPRPMHHPRMSHMMSQHHMNMPLRPHDMQSSMPQCPPFKMKSEPLSYDDPSTAGEFRVEKTPPTSSRQQRPSYSYENSTDDSLTGSGGGGGGVGQRNMMNEDASAEMSSSGSVGFSGIEAVVAAAAAAAAVAGETGVATTSSTTSTATDCSVSAPITVTSVPPDRGQSRAGMVDMASPPPPPTGSTTPSGKPESYQLRHNNHMSLVLNQLAADEAFMDVTLTAEGRALKAHKSVLSAVSPYFSSVLRANPCQHPIIIMPRDIRYMELTNIIMYIYKGEMTVSAEELPSLLKTAELLRITGLSPGESQQQPVPSKTSGGSSQQSFSGDNFSSNTFNASVNSNVSSFNNQYNRSATGRNNQQQTSAQQQQQTASEGKNKLSPPSRIDSPVQTMLNPSDFMDLDMTCVKEEMNSDNEDAEETDEITSREVTTPPTIENPLSSANEKRDKKSPDNVQPNLEAAPDESGDVNAPESSKSLRSIEDTTAAQNDDDDDVKLNSLKTLASLASLDTPTNLSPSDSCSPRDSSATISEPSPNICPYCSEYVTGDEISNHLSSKHAFKPAFICPTCARVYTRKSGLELHSKGCSKES